MSLILSLSQIVLSQGSYRFANAQHALVFLSQKMETNDTITKKDIEAVLKQWQQEKGSLKDFPLIVFISKNSELLKEIIESHPEIDLNHYESAGVNNEFPKVTALYCAVEMDDQKSAEILLEHGAKVDNGVLDGPIHDGGNLIPPLNQAYLDKNKPMMKILVSKDACLASTRERAVKDKQKECSFFSQWSKECKDTKDMLAFIENLSKK